MFIGVFLIIYPLAPVISLASAKLNDGDGTDAKSTVSEDDIGTPLPLTYSSTTLNELQRDSRIGDDQIDYSKRARYPNRRHGIMESSWTPESFPGFDLYCSASKASK